MANTRNPVQPFEVSEAEAAPAESSTGVNGGNRVVDP